MQMNLYYNPILNKFLVAIQVSKDEYMVSEDGYRYKGTFVKLLEEGYELVGEYV